MRRERQSWTRDVIVQALLDRKSGGLALNSGAVQKSHSGLGRAILKLFGSHDAALLAAGIDPKTVRQKTPRDSAWVIASLQGRHDAGRGVNSRAIKSDDLALAGAIVKCFDSHDAALRAAGLDPQSIRKHATWDKPGIIAALRERQASGAEMHAAAVQKSQNGLYQVAGIYFGSYYAALSAAGIDPEPIRRRDQAGTWDRDKVIAALLARKSRGEALNFVAVQDSDGRLVHAIHTHFGSHDAALKAAGVDPASMRKASWWDDARVIAALHARHDAGLKLNVAAIALDDQNLGWGIRSRFGSHDAALRAAGLDPASIRQRMPCLDKAQIVDAIRRRREAGLSINAGHRSPSKLYRSAQLQFGTYDAALTAAGIDPASVRKVLVWDKPRILAALRARRDAGLELNVRAVQADDPRLAGAIDRHFGSWDAALRAAGADPESIRKKVPRRDKAGIVADLQDRQARGLALSPMAMSRSPKGKSLYQSARHHFGSFDAALRAARIAPDSVRWKRCLNRGEVIEALRRRRAKRVGLSERSVASTNRTLHQAILSHFQSHDAALRAAGIDPALNSGDSAGHWTAKTVLRTLCDMHRDGHDLRYRPMKTHSQPLFFAAKKLFGSYVNAVREAGIDYWQMSQVQLAKERAAGAK